MYFLAGYQKLMWSSNFWLDLVDKFATQSYAKNMKVACVLVKGKHFVSAGVNGTLAGLPNDCEDSQGRSMHDIVVHAEMNAIANASDKNDIIGCTAYLNYGPCENCAKTLLQFGIKKLHIRGGVKYPDVIQTCIDYLGEENVKIEIKNEIRFKLKRGKAKTSNEDNYK